MRPTPGRRGFTITEMLVTVAILAILAGAAIPLAQNSIKREKEIELSRSLRLMREAIDAYKRLADEKKIKTEQDAEGYPPDLQTLVKGVEVSGGSREGASEKRTIRFLRRIPKDPMTNSFDWGLRSSQDGPDSDSWGGENVYDVYTKSRGKALDGSKYRDW
ncbi:MAG: type II secretion system protein [Candidatus Aminicenantales bacterium]